MMLNCVAYSINDQITAQHKRRNIQLLWSGPVVYIFHCLISLEARQVMCKERFHGLIQLLEVLMKHG